MKTRILTLFLVLISSVAFSQNRYTPHYQSLYDPGLFDDDMTMITEVSIEGVVQNVNYLEIGVFCGDEVRGYGMLEDYQKVNYVAFVQLVGFASQHETLTFRLWNHETNSELDFICTNEVAVVSDATFGTIDNPYRLYFFNQTNYTFDNNGGTGDGKWSTIGNWKVDGVAATILPNEGSTCAINANCQLDINANVYKTTVKSGTVLTVNSNNVLESKSMTISGSASVYTGFVLEDGAQFLGEGSNLRGTVKKTIAAYTSGRDNYYFLSSPINNLAWNKTGMIDGEFDLYFFDGWAYGAEWQNYEYDNELDPFANMCGKRGYLYANQSEKVLTFPGKFLTAKSVTIPNDNDEITLEFSDELEDNPWACYNLIGNPFVFNANATGTNIAGFYMINVENNRKNVIPCTNPIVAPCTGIIAVTNGEDAHVTFSQSKADATVRNTRSFINLEVCNADGGLIDRAYVEMGESTGMSKFNLNDEVTQFYFRENNKDYAILAANDATQLPLYFETREYGTYTINVKLENMNCEYLHLIDNLTGMDVDLNVTPSYTFRANQGDYASRFKLVFEGTNVEENNANENFAIVEGNRVIIPMIEHETTLDIIDMTGRTISSQKVNGSFDQTLNVNAGIYLLRMNGNVQKIVVR